VIFRGDIYWVSLGNPSGSEPAGRRPMVVVQNDIANQSAIRTVLVCALTTNVRLARARGNVLLELSEAQMPLQSVVNVSQVYTVDKSELTDETYIGTLSLERMDQIITGLQLFL